MNNRVKRLFGRYQSGQANKHERKIVEDWFTSFEKAPAEELSEKDKIALFSPIDQEIDRMLSTRQPRNLFYNRWLYATAAAIVFIFLNVTLFRYYQGVNQHNAVITYTTVMAPKGTKKQVSLPDGTVVSLNSGSGIRIPSNFGVKTREISLLGEAFFVVKHNAAKPFAIHSGKLLITDLGTEFDVKAYPEDRQIRVAVESGKVKVEKNNAGGKPEMFAEAITHNQQLVYDEQSNGHKISQIQTTNLTAWQQNKLRFDNASIDEIAHTLDRWYNVKVTLDHYKACRHYTVSFNNEPLDHVLNVLSQLTGLSYQIKNKDVLINLQNCKSMK